VRSGWSWPVNAQTGHWATSGWSSALNVQFADQLDTTDKRYAVYPANQEQPRGQILEIRLVRHLFSQQSQSPGLTTAPTSKIGRGRHLGPTPGMVKPL
jgi:hypothetical protein